MPSSPSPAGRTRGGLRRGPRERQSDHHRETAARGVFRRQGTAHSLRESAGEREAEAEARGVIGIALALERREHSLAALGRNALAVVGDADLRPIAQAARRDVHGPIGRRVPVRVGEHVDEDALQQHGVGTDEWQSGIESQGHLVGAEAQLVERRDDDARDIRRGE